MNKILMGLIFCQALNIPVLAIANQDGQQTKVLSTSATSTVQIPIEVSALLQNQIYTNILFEQSEIAKSSGKTLCLSAFSVLDLGPTKYVYIFLTNKTSASVTGESTPAGSIVGSIIYGPLGEVLFDGVFFKPAEQLPGGASVGNN